ncbi:hypothetical protein B2J93_4957 [Marssonina coronariae]|uniref:Uncharacterized protein n=1 Tax=Diplocarpon coronariae TaxID=2795749 RepID=A0A218ZHG5_9HELO|nr:hypothetical protein B2J93_4957 [Marssonina coronariae]
MPEKPQHGSEQEIRSRGSPRVFTWIDNPPHSHRGLTAHLILEGQLAISYPREKEPEKTFGIGERIDVEAGRTQQVWIGPEGCTYVMGE